MKCKVLRTFFLGALFFVLGANSVFAGTVKMRIVVVNPSDSKPQIKEVRNYLPKEVSSKDVVDDGGLQVDYDEEKGLFYVIKKDVELAPLETKVFEVVINDIWMVPEDQIQEFRARTQRILERLKNTAYFEQAQTVAKTITGRLDEISKTQGDETVTKQQHIAYYRDNIKILESIREDIEKLEKLLVAVGGPPNLKVIEESKINLKSPTSKTTWIIIFAVLAFIAILAGTFYFTWMGQAKITENIFTKEKDAAFSEFKDEEAPKDSTPKTPSPPSSP